MQEIVLICAIALVVVGPKKLPELARALGKGYGEFRRAFDEMKRNVETDFQTDEIRRSILDLPPPPSPLNTEPYLPPESLLTDQVAVKPTVAPLPFPYSEKVDAAPPTPEHPLPVAPPPAGTSSGQSLG